MWGCRPARWLNYTPHVQRLFFSKQAVQVWFQLVAFWSLSPQISFAVHCLFPFKISPKNKLKKGSFMCDYDTTQALFWFSPLAVIELLYMEGFHSSWTTLCWPFGWICITNALSLAGMTLLSLGIDQHIDSSTLITLRPIYHQQGFHPPLLHLLAENQSLLIS